MGYRLSKIVTKTGDDGTTQIEPGKRIPKDHLRICALGDIDELNSALGLVLAYSSSHEKIRSILQHVQQDLFYLGGELCPPYRPTLTEENILFLEEAIFTYNNTLPPLTEFILPGGNLLSAHCHLARTICRRAERSLVSLNHSESISKIILQYMNRLSDLLFVLGRILARETSTEEIQWKNNF